MGHHHERKQRVRQCAGRSCRSSLSTSAARDSSSRFAKQEYGRLTLGDSGGDASCHPTGIVLCNHGGQCYTLLIINLYRVLFWPRRH
jgi:hypothetical protein